MRENPVEGLSPSHSTDARSAALRRPVSIGEGSRLLPAAVDTPVQAESRDDATSSQAAEFDVWEDEGGAPAGHPPEFPRGHAKRHFDELSA